jgi:hypothetical protein
MPCYRNPDFRRLPPDLAGLFERAGDRSFFAQAGWYDLMARHGVDPGDAVRLYVGGEGDAKAALLLREEGGSGRRLVSLANAYSVEHGLVTGGESGAAPAIAAIIAELLREQPQLEALRLLELDPADPSYPALMRQLRRAGLLVEQVFDSGTWYEETQGLSFADYVAGRPAELRNTWNRKRRKLEKSQRLASAFFADDSDIERAIADYGTIYAASWKPAEGYPDFIPALIRLAAEQRALRLGIYYIDGEPAAAQMWILWRGRAVIYKLAHDQRFDSLSLGTILTMEMTQRVLEQDRPFEINLGRGDDPYKRLWLPKRRERWGLQVANPRNLAGLRLGLKREAAKLYHRLRGERISPFG